MYPFRRLSAKALLRWSFGLLLVGSLISVSGGLSFQQWPAADQQEMVDFWNPGEEAIAEAVGDVEFEETRYDAGVQLGRRR